MEEQINNDIYNQNRLPLGLFSFSDIRTSKMIYVDKTELIAKFATQRTPIFFSRPRRFGKSLLVNTLHSLFANGLDHFHGLAIEKIWKDTRYKVVHLDFSRMASKNTENLKRSLGKKIIQEFCVTDTVALSDSQGLKEPDMILDEIASSLPDKSVVLLIDEYDAPLTHHLDRPNELQSIMGVLNDFYATVKQYTSKFRFIFITGITRTSHVSIFSAFNNLKDLSLRKEFNSLLGFSKNDLIHYFDPYVENAAHALKVSKNNLYNRLEQYYDGFQFSLDAEETLYNPWSILNFFDSPQEGFHNYWFESGGVSSLITKYLKINNKFDLLNYKKREISIPKNLLSSRFEISNIPQEILLFQAGYFTIRKETNQTAQFIFPNTEVEDSMLNLYFVANNIVIHDETQHKLDSLSENIDRKNLALIVNIFNEILNECVSILSNIFTDERSVRDIIYAALPQEIYLQKIKERETTKGKSDLEIITPKTHMVIEFKRTKPDRDAAASLQEAIEQMRCKNYGIGAFKDHKLYRVAMVISTEEKSIILDFCKEI